METLFRRVRLPVPAAAAFAWHARPGAFDRLAPPWERVEVVERCGGIEDGARVVLRVGPLRTRWQLEHREFAEGVRFADHQVAGPFAHWRHVHLFHEVDGGTCELEDSIEYALPGGAFGRTLAAGFVRARLERLFDFRHRVTHDDLAAHARAPGPLRVAVTGASGLFGSTLVPFLTSGGHTVIRLVRRSPRAADELAWDPARGLERPAALEGVDAVVHLSGAGIADQRWTPARKRELRDSRIVSTRTLCTVLAGLERPPRVLVVASAVGYYGDRGDERLTEDSGPGNGFLAGLACDWEAAARVTEGAGVRVVHLRSGIVLTPRGGALARLLLPFRLGVGGPIGDGRAWWSWIALDDVIGLIHFAITQPAVSGPLNAVAPHPVTNRELASALGRTLHRPALLPLPALALEALFGEMAREVLLASTRAEPARALRAGYPFRFTDLDAALAHVLGTALRKPARRERHP